MAIQFLDQHRPLLRSLSLRFTAVANKMTRRLHCPHPRTAPRWHRPKPGIALGTAQTTAVHTDLVTDMTTAIRTTSLYQRKVLPGRQQISPTHGQSTTRPSHCLPEYLGLRYPCRTRPMSWAPFLMSPTEFTLSPVEIRPGPRSDRNCYQALPQMMSLKSIAPRIPVSPSAMRLRPQTFRKTSKSDAAGVEHQSVLLQPN